MLMNADIYTSNPATGHATDSRSNRTRQPTTGTRARNRRYRAKHRRIDYAPSSDALAIITLWKERKLDNCMAGVLDKLLMAGHQALMREQPVSGNSAE